MAPKARNREKIVREPYVLRPIHPISALVYAGAEVLRSEDDHPVGTSPSSVNYCRFRQWAQIKGYPPSEKLPVESQKKMESGRAVEDFWRKVYERAGFHVESPVPRVTIAGFSAGGQADGIITVAREDTAKAIGYPIGARGVLELKDLGLWTYKDVVDKGWEEGAPEYFSQAQVYGEGYDVDFCLLHAGMADASAVRWYWNRMAKREVPLPPFWVEVFPRDTGWFASAKSRAEEVNWFVENVDDAYEADAALTDHRDFLTRMDVEGAKGFPCYYCLWKGFHRSLWKVE